jgi:hypothetical protein
VQECIWSSFFPLNIGEWVQRALQLTLSRIRNSHTPPEGCWWLTPGILATQETEIRRITVGSQLEQIVREIPSRKNSTQKRVGGVAQGVGPEFKSPYHTHKTKQKKKGKKERKEERNSNVPQPKSLCCKVCMLEWGDRAKATFF